MRVAFIHPFLFRYARGIERFTFCLANELARAGCDVHLVTWRWPHPLSIDALDPHVHVHTLPTSRYYAAEVVVPFYVWHLLKAHYDFVWVYFAGYGEAPALNLLRRQRFGIVFHYPARDVPYRYRQFRRSGLGCRAAQVVSVSQYVADGVLQSLGQASHIIPHGVDHDRFAPSPETRAAVRRQLGLSGDEFLLVTAAALEERKGIQRVLRALPMVVTQFPNVRYLVAGEGPYRAVLETLTEEQGLTDKVRFIGAQPQVERYLQAADLSLILATGEASSLVTLESLSCGVPVIAANRPPFHELIRSDYGLLVDEENAVEVAEGILGLLLDADRRLDMGRAGRRRICAAFTWERAAQQYRGSGQ